MLRSLDSVSNGTCLSLSFVDGSIALPSYFRQAVRRTLVVSNRSGLMSRLSDLKISLAASPYEFSRMAVKIGHCWLGIMSRFSACRRLPNGVCWEVNASEFRICFEYRARDEGLSGA